MEEGKMAGYAGEILKVDLDREEIVRKSWTGTWPRSLSGVQDWPHISSIS